MSAWRAEVDATLERLLPAAGTDPRALHEAMRYAVFAGGKRLRPILCLAGCAAAGGDHVLALPVGAALEMIHTYSLVHDDLPAMDDDALRRGRPTTHVVFGEATGILAGDALLTLAFETLASEPGGDAHAGRRAAVCALVARAAGAAGMVGGQQADLDATGQDGPAGPGDESRLLAIHRRKTGALLTASVAAGAVIAGADETACARLTRYGDAVGLAFQIVDDILDVEATTEQLGKSAGKDTRDRKLTFPALHGVAGSRARAAALVEQARAEVRALGTGGERLDAIAAFVLERGS